MRRTTALPAFLPALSCFAAVLPVPARATEEDTQFWLAASARVPLADDVSATVEASPRWRADNAGGEQGLVRGTLDAKLNGWLGVGGGAAYSRSTGPNETRLFQQFTLAAGNFAFRTQIEERFFDGAQRVQLRGRERVQLTLPVDPGDRFVGSAELFYILQPQNPAQDDHVDNWRFKGEWRHKLSSALELGAGYLLILAPRENAPDRISHIPQLSLNYSF